ncbi:MAG: class I SAM-dependent methyltransferase [Oscillospiraceae bacterium]|nr:class I SAM-dependent methyltransferase [Oscillospiraceae bacterium]
MPSIDMYITDEYVANNPTYHTEDSLWKATQILKIIRRNELHPDSVCEVGCGAGEVLRQIYLNMDERVQFIGYDISPSAFKLASKRQSKRLDFKLADFLLEEDSVHYSIVLAIDVIEHIENLFDFLRVLKERGEYKIFHVPLEMSAKSVIATSQLKFRKKYGHIHYFSKETLFETLRDTGYEVVDYFYTKGFLELPTKKNLVQRIFNLLFKIGFKMNKDLTVRLLGGPSIMVLTK